MLVDDSTSNFVYFSKIFAKSFHNLFLKIIDVLDENAIHYDILLNTKDIWCKDFMPHQVEKNYFVNFVFNPDYLQKSPHLKTHINKVLINMEIEKIVDFPLILEGGNIVRHQKHLVICEKVLSQNKRFYTTHQVFDLLHEYLKVEKIIVLPQQPFYNYSGHADQMVRFVKDRYLIINDFSMESEHFRTRLKYVLNNSAMELYHFKYHPKYHPLFIEKIKWEVYFNYLELHNLIIVPILGVAEDDLFIKKMKILFPNKNIVGIECPEIIYLGGGFNRLLWNIQV